MKKPLKFYQTKSGTYIAYVRDDKPAKLIKYFVRAKEDKKSINFSFV